MTIPKTILIVDDSETDQHSYRRTFRDRNEYKLVAALSAEAGLAAVADAKPDLILLDYNLPDMDGLSFMSRLANSPSASIPVIMLTGEGNESLAVEAMKNGAVDYLVKHVDGRHLKLLPTVIWNALRKHEALEAKKAAEKALKESESRLKEMFENLSSGVAVYQASPDGQDFIFTAFNRAAERIENMRREDLIGKNVVEVFPSIMEFGLLEVFRRVWKSGVAEHFPVSFYQGGHVAGWRENYVYKLLNGDIVAIYDDVTKEKQAQEQIYHLAHHDILTGLPNRALFFDRLQQSITAAKRGKAYLALMFLDLDNFKPVNDTLGHDVGDLLLKEVAKRLLKCVRESDTIARMGGDEFVVLLPAIEAEQDAILVAEKILSALGQPFDLAGHGIQTSSSIGIAVYPEHGGNENLLIKNADIAMYCAKRSGRNNMKLYRHEIMEWTPTSPNGI